MPELSFNGAVETTQGGCYVSVYATVTATTEPAKLLVNDTIALYPTAILWKNSYSVARPYLDFSAHVISITDRLMKEFVNDWATSQ